MNGNKYLQNFSCQKRNKVKVAYGVTKLKKQGTVKSNIVISIIS